MSVEQYDGKLAPDKPRSLKYPAEIESRRLLLAMPPMKPLREYVAELRTSNSAGIEFPDFDPLDGGINAKILFLFEKPGPRTSRHGGGSGFISRNNNDAIAQAVFEFMNEAGLPRTNTVIWNIVPGWDGTRTIKRGTIKSGINEVKRLMQLLAQVTTIVLVGRVSQRALPFIQHLGPRVLISAPPSPIVRASRPDTWKQIPIQWAKAREDF